MSILKKTKVMIFEKRKRRRNNVRFTLRDGEIEIIDSYTYLGLLLRYNCNFNVSKKKLVEQS